MNKVSPNLRTKKLHVHFMNHHLYKTKNEWGVLGRQASGMLCVGAHGLSKDDNRLVRTGVRHLRGALRWQYRPLTPINHGIFDQKITDSFES